MMRYEDFMNKRFLKAVSGESDTDYDEEMVPVAALPAHLAEL